MYGGLAKEIKGINLPVMYETRVENIYAPSIPKRRNGIRERESVRRKKKTTSKAGERFDY